MNNPPLQHIVLVSKHTWRLSGRGKAQPNRYLFDEEVEGGKRVREGEEGKPCLNNNINSHNSPFAKMLRYPTV